MLLNKDGGIIDDSVICISGKTEANLVVNGTNKSIVLEYLQTINSAGKFGVHIELEQDLGLIALQGPKSSEILDKLFKESDAGILSEEVPFMGQFVGKCFGWREEYRVSRSGYTGEDGF